MDWYETAVKKMVQNELYSHKTLVTLLCQEKPGLSPGGYHWAIEKLVQRGDLVKKGYGEYSVSNGQHLRTYVPTYSAHALSLTKELSEKYPHVVFTVFETVLLNSFLNHLIGQNTVFFQIEKESSVHVFRYFQEEDHKNVLYKPSLKDYLLYWDSGTIVITDLVTEAPLRNDEPHSIMLEKMLVDICSDKLIASTFSRAELPDIFEQAGDRYILDRPRMMRYARRRHREDEIRKYIGGR